MKFSQRQRLFIEFYHTLTRAHQWILKKIHKMAKDLPHCYPSHNYLADISGWCTKTVARALNKFFAAGWITWIQRGYSSNQYFFEDEILALDLDNPKTFQRHEPLPSVPGYQEKTTVSPEMSAKCPMIYKSINKDNIHKNTYGTCPKRKFFKKDIIVPTCLNIPALPIEDRHKIVLQFPQYIIEQAVSKIVWLMKNKRILPKTNIAAWITETCKYILKDDPFYETKIFRANG